MNMVVYAREWVWRLRRVGWQRWEEEEKVRIGMIFLKYKKKKNLLIDWKTGGSW